MRYVKVYIGSEAGDPGLTLYEVDQASRVHRHVCIRAEAAKFVPEDHLMLQTVNVDYMAAHPVGEEFDKEEFEKLWNEVQEGRPFRRQLPDPSLSWEGVMDFRGRAYEVRWLPDASDTEGWTRVPGFDRLSVKGDQRAAWAVQAAVFLESKIRWRPFECPA